MRFSAIWDQLCQKRPKLTQDDATIEIKSVALKALLRQVYEQGERHRPEPEPRQYDSPISAEQFSQIFGGR